MEKLLGNPLVILTFIAAGCLALVHSCGCSAPGIGLPRFGYGQAEYHAGRDIEKEQGLRREADGWIVAEDARYRMIKRDGKDFLEWIVCVSNITDIPRRASCSIVGSFTNYAAGAEVCLTANDGGRIVLPPRTPGEISGAVLAPNSSLVSFSRRVVLPSPAPQCAGPVTIRCTSWKDGKATLEWASTMTGAQHEITATWKDAQGRSYTIKKTLKPVAYDVAVALYDNDGVEIAHDSNRVDFKPDGMKASGKVEVTLEQAADVARVTAQWKGILPAEKPVSMRRMRVTAYCPCVKCCGKDDGITAWQTDAWLPGIAAARDIPFGTSLIVPGYGRALVDDRGRKIFGNRLDVRFQSHATARAWGTRWLDVLVEG